MKTFRPAVLVSLTLLAACSGGGGGANTPANTPVQPTDPQVLDLTDTWDVTSEVIDVEDGEPTPELGLHGSVELALHLDLEVDFYSARFVDIAARPLPNWPTSVELVYMPGDNPRVFFGGVYYLASQDVTIELFGGLPMPEEVVSADGFTAIVIFDVYDGDAMVVETVEGFDEWAIAESAYLRSSGRARVVGLRR